MKELKIIILSFLFLLLFVSCSEKENNAQLSDDKLKNKHKIEALFDNSSGEEIYKANCVSCHSLKYIEMQPALPNKTWEKIVDKMIKNFGAPIPDSSSKVIINYLVSIKGIQK